MRFGRNKVRLGWDTGITANVNGTPMSVPVLKQVGVPGSHAGKRPPLKRKAGKNGAARRGTR